jgi:tRNA(adenine34) deaminase
MSGPKNDEFFMLKALAEARKAADRGEVPVGAIVVKEGLILGRGHNRPISNHDPTAHAEVIALRAAARRLGNYRLTGCDLYVSLEPCAMCLGAVAQARVRRLVYGAPDPKSGAVVSIMRFPFDKLNHRPAISAGLMAEECAAVLKAFFREKRRRQRTETQL